jgi:hypothetical protein
MPVGELDKAGIMWLEWTKKEWIRNFLKGSQKVKQKWEGPDSDG